MPPGAATTMRIGFIHGKSGEVDGQQNPCLGRRTIHTVPDTGAVLVRSKYRVGARKRQLSAFQEGPFWAQQTTWETGALFRLA